MSRKGHPWAKWTLLNSKKYFQDYQVPYLALNSSLAAAAVPRVTVEAAVTTTLLPGQTYGTQISLFSGIYTGNT